MDIKKIFLALAIPMSIAFAIFILPFNVPDEGSHFTRAYDISQGNIFTQIDENGNSFSTVLKEIEDDSYTRFSSYKDVFIELSKTTNYDEKVEKVCAAQANSPILYLGTSIAIKICEILNVNIFFGLYLARIFNVIIYLIFGYLTIKKIPFGKLLMAIYLCMPMMLQQAASCSADSILNAVLIYYIAHLIYMVFKETPTTKKDKIILYIFTALIAMFKYIYILVAGILFITAFAKKEERKKNLKTIVIMILIGAVCAVGWFAYSLSLTSQSEAFAEYFQSENIDASKQIDYIKENTLHFIITFAKEYLFYEQQYIFEAVGTKLGWLDVEINMGIIVTYIIILIITAISEENKYEFTNKSKLWVLSIIFAISIILKTVMYVTWTPIGADRIWGLQGRYYTPILFLAILCLVKKDTNWKVKHLDKKMIVISFALNILTLVTVIKNYL